MTKVRGRFYFKLTESGNLVGEYSHWAIPENRPESALRMKSDTPPTFAGTYTSCWFEPQEGEPVSATLTIDKRTPAVFTLHWKMPRNEFRGEGMLCDGVLVGDYEQM